MNKTIMVGALMVSAMTWAGAQQPSGPPETSRSSQVPGASQPQTATPGGADQSGPQGSAAGATGAGATATQAGNAPITEGCLGGSNPNYTLSNASGKSYKLVLPPNADGSKLAAHVGEPVMVMGDVNGDSINITKIGKGNGTCPGK